MGLQPIYEEQLLAIVPKFTGAIGFPACCLLMREIYLANNQGEGNGNPILRSLAGVAFFLSMTSLGWFLSTWAVPEGQFTFATGNVASCAFQGFLLQVAIGAPLFSVAMAWYFWLVVVFGKTTDDLYRYEKIVSPLIVLYSFISAFLLLGLDQYNHVGAVCWVMGSPAGCENSAFHEDLTTPCDRGNWAWAYGVAMFEGLILCCICLIIVFNISIYMKLDDDVEATWFARQSLFYTLAFFITWAPSTTWSVLHWTADGGNFWVDLASALLVPIGGLWYLLIFLQDRPASRRRITRYLCLECFEESEAGTSEIDEFAIKRPAAPSGEVIPINEGDPEKDPDDESTGSQS